MAQAAQSNALVLHPDRAIIRQQRRTKRTLRTRIELLAKRGHFGRIRAKGCFELIGIDPALYTPITPYSFEVARKRWISAAREAREEGDPERERAINIVWTHLKNWRCPVCGGLKRRSGSETCGNRCRAQWASENATKKLSPLILRLDPNGSHRATGTSYRGHALRRAQVDMLNKALADCGYNMRKAAKQLGMARSTLRYYVKKFSAPLGPSQPCHESVSDQPEPLVTVP